MGTAMDARLGAVVVVVGRRARMASLCLGQDAHAANAPARKPGSGVGVRRGTSGPCSAW